jgi:hypothetical protein
MALVAASSSAIAGEVIIRAATPAASINPLNIVSSFCINSE